MISGIRSMIARCMERMRQGACATCENRTVCPAAGWQRMFSAVERQPDRGSGAALSFLGGLLEALSPQPVRRCFKAEVEAVIEPMLATGEVGIERVADQLGMSRQTLYRRLKAEGVTFEDLLDGKRRQLAVRYLAAERNSVKTTAYRLGFSEPAAFSRAFKRWTGVSPSYFRTV